MSIYSKHYQDTAIDLEKSIPRGATIEDDRQKTRESTETAGRSYDFACLQLCDAGLTRCAAHLLANRATYAERYK